MNTFEDQMRSILRVHYWLAEVELISTVGKTREVCCSALLSALHLLCAAIDVLRLCVHSAVYIETNSTLQDYPTTWRDLGV